LVKIIVYQKAKNDYPENLKNDPTFIFETEKAIRRILNLRQEDTIEVFEGEGPRPELLSFANMMEDILIENDDEKGTSWKDLELAILLQKLKDEFKELMNKKNLIHNMDEFPYLEVHDQEAIKKECLDLANLCMMVWNRLD